MVLEWLAAHWLLLFIVTVVWITIGLAGMFTAVAREDGLVATIGLILTFTSWIPTLAFLVGLVMAIFQHFR